MLFPLLFLTLIGTALLVLARSIAASWERIVAALDGRLVIHPEPERVLGVSTCRPIDLPYVARRMGRPTVSERPLASVRRRAA
ncbi:hypothetical protein [Sphingomonas parva]|nr:hypothetical protein [Sphingomonas parva]